MTIDSTKIIDGSTTTPEPVKPELPTYPEGVRVERIDSGCGNSIYLIVRLPATGTRRAYDVKAVICQGYKVEISAFEYVAPNVRMASIKLGTAELDKDGTVTLKSCVRASLTRSALEATPFRVHPAFAGYMAQMESMELPVDQGELNAWETVLRETAVKLAPSMVLASNELIESEKYRTALRNHRDAIRQAEYTRENAERRAQYQAQIAEEARKRQERETARKVAKAAKDKARRAAAKAQRATPACPMHP
jgi:hypothetical protein